MLPLTENTLAFNAIGLHFWWLLAGGLVVVELFTGTFYLLMIALGCFIGGATALLGFSVPVQLIISAVVALSAIYFLRRSRLTTLKKHVQQISDNNLDLGALVQVNAWQGRRARALYRGTQWDVELAEGEPSAGQWYEIKAMRGNLLVVAAKHNNN